MQANFLSHTSATQSLVYCSCSLKDLNVNISCLSMNLNTCWLNFLLFERIWDKLTLIVHMYSTIPPFPSPTNEAKYFYYFWQDISSPLDWNYPFFYFRSLNYEWLKKIRTVSTEQKWFWTAISFFIVINIGVPMSATPY